MPMLFVRRAVCGIALSVSWSLTACATGSSEDLPRIEREPVAWATLWPEVVAGPPGPSGVIPAARPTAEQIEALKAAEALYRQPDDEAFAAARDRLGADPLAGFLLARMLNRYLLWHREQQPVRRAEEMMAGLAPWQRPFDHLVALGRPAVPMVVLDLLRDTRGNRRQLGVEILAGMGDEVLDELRPLLDVPDDLVRTALVQAVAGWEWSERTAPVLAAASRDDFFGVRAAAWSGYADGGAEAAATIRTAYDREDDVFVRRAMLRALGGHRDIANAALLRSEYERALDAADTDTVEAALDGLRRMSGDPRLAGPGPIRAFVEGLSERRSAGSIGGDR